MNYNLKVSLIVCLCLIEICSVFLMWKSLSARETTLDSVKLKDIKSNNMFAIMLEQSDGTYTESSNTTWPTDMKYNETLSGCIDAAGNIIDGALTYDNSTNIASVSTSKTSYCYLYFDIKKLNGEYLLENPTTGLNTTMEGGLYRYQGTTADNYICFGTSDKSTCTGNTDAYMYRIIGINSSGQLKLIKKEALNSSMAWHSSNTNTTWPNSTIYSNLNGSSFLSNTKYVPSGWSSKIATTSWKYGDNTTYNTTAANLYLIENAWTSTTSAKIGLMYTHDYYYGMSGGNDCSSSGAYTTCKTSWLHLSNSDSGAPDSDEWFMSRYGANGSIYSAWYVYSVGGVAWDGKFAQNSVRPVFYLTSDVEIVSGTGTSSDPFIIN